MARYSIAGAAGAASTTAATAGIIKVESSSTTTAARVYEISVGPGAAAEDSNYTIRLKRQTTAGTWTSATPAPLDAVFRASSSTGGIASTAAGTASTILATWGFNQRGGFRWVAVPGGEFVNINTNAYGIILEYAVIQGTAVNYATMLFEE